MIFKDHVTLKTGVIVLKILLCHHWNALILKDIQIENNISNCNNISHCCFTVFLSNKSSLGEPKGHSKILLASNLMLTLSVCQQIDTEVSAIQTIGLSRSSRREWDEQNVQVSRGAYLWGLIWVIMSFSFSMGFKGNSRAWRRWSTGMVENGDRNTGATGK